MTDALIVLNAGSSSLKLSIYSVADSDLQLIARGQIQGLGTSPRFTVKDNKGQTLADLNPQSSSKEFSHSQAFAFVAQWIQQKYADQFKLIGVGHRIVHGGSHFTAPTLLNATVLEQLEQLIPLAPLHQPHNLEAIRAVMKSHPHLPQVGCFDTAFHHGRAKVTQRFGLPNELFRQGIQRWGFHGLSYESISTKLRKLAPELAQGRVIVAHLGSGASLCAIHDGLSVDTTMSFSTLDGLPMGTRCGNLDPGVILYLLEKGMTRQQIEGLLYNKSGLLGISGVSNDVRDLLKSQDSHAAEAIDFFVYRITREIGSLTAALGGLDGLIFTAGIGENSPIIRERVCKLLAWLDIAVDNDANQKNTGRISPQNRGPAVWVIPTDEEGMIASHMLSLLRPQK